MGDKHRSEIQKPVKNTLLSGASHGFPFESFQGSSLLIPVSQDSPSVLNDSVADVNKLVGHPENLSQITEGVGTATLGEITSQQEPRSPPQAAPGQGYTGIFSSFFGGGSQKKQDMDLGQGQRKNSDQPSLASSTPRSSSPFVTIPNIQSFSPVLQVPGSQAEASPKPMGFSHSVDSAFSHIQTATPQQSFQPVTVSGNPPESFQKVELPKIPTLTETKQPEQTEIKNFFTADNKPVPGIGFVEPNLCFELFHNNMPSSSSTGVALSKAQSAIELPVGGTAAHPAADASSFFDGSQPQFYQARSESADSFKPIQPPPMGVASPLPSGPPLPSGAPPMSTGIASRNYRRDHHKRLAYAPVPGLTSNTSVPTSFLQPRENFSPSLSSSTLTSPSEPLRQPLTGSLSQPALNLSGANSQNLSSSLNNPSTTSQSIQNFFNSSSFPPSTSPSQSFEAFSNPAVVSPVPADPIPPNINAPAKLFNPIQAVNPLTGPPPAGASTHMVSSLAVHPPIMSTKEQSVIPTASVTERPPSPVVIPASLNNLANLGTSGIIYRPAYHHWFIRYETKESKEYWQPFSMTDSLALEQAFNSDKLTPDTVIPTDGGRYDVNVTKRIRNAVYWEEEPKAVRRCSWFYKSTTESRLHPYDENTAYNLEEEYKKAVTTSSWTRKVDLPSGDHVIMYGPSSMALFQSSPQTPEGWEAEPDYSQNTGHRPKIVKRGVLDDFEIDDGEAAEVDQLIFVVHGIGSVCDFKFRTIEEAGDSNSILDPSQLLNNKIAKVNGFRSKSLQLIKTHFRTLVEQGTVNRVEILPVSWHHHLHGENTGVDKKLQTITLKSIPKLRDFTNDTLLDILFYTSPVYCQNIVQQVGKEINTLYAKFKARNPKFKGGVSLVGHSLGSLILFDILCHQKPPSPRMEKIKEETKAGLVEHEVTTITSPGKKKMSLNRSVSYVMGIMGTGQPFIEYPQFLFQPVAFFAMGSPIGMFVTVRGIDSLGPQFCLPTCSRFFNVFHPFDPVAYRIEALVNPELAEKRPVLIPHHKGRKRMHLELKETMARMGADLKQRLVDSVRSTWNTVYQLTMFGRADDGLEQEVDKVIEKQLERQRSESVGNGINEAEEADCNAGRLNQGRRIDYVLQEAPLESFNEYVFALSSHVIYWDSEDTMLLILKEIYGSMGLAPDNQQGGISGMQEDITVTTAAPSTSFQDPDAPSTSHGQEGRPPYPPPSYGFK